MPRTWNSILCSFASGIELAKVSYATVFVFGEEIVTCFADAESYWVLPGAWDLHFLFILSLYFSGKSICSFVGQDVAISFISARTWIFVSDSFH